MKFTGLATAARNLNMSHTMEAEQSFMVVLKSMKRIAEGMNDLEEIGLVFPEKQEAIHLAYRSVDATRVFGPDMCYTLLPESLARAGWAKETIRLMDEEKLALLQLFWKQYPAESLFSQPQEDVKRYLRGSFFQNYMGQPCWISVERVRADECLLAAES